MHDLSQPFDHLPLVLITMTGNSINSDFLMEEIVLYERVEGGQPVNLRANHGRHDKHTLTYTNTTNGKKSSILSIRMRK